MKTRRLLPTRRGLLMTVLFYRFSFKVCAATSGAMPCTSSQFTCNNGKCVSLNFVCNGIDSCGDNSDELQNCCTKSQFTCDNGRCESQDFVCDGFDDCGDNSDEQDCSNVNVGLAVGLSLGAPFLIVCLGIVGGCLFYCCKKRHPSSTHVVTTATGAAAITAQNSHTSPTHPPHTPPAPYPPRPASLIHHNSIQLANYPPQPQPMQQEPQLNFRAPPPSYDAATSYQLPDVAPYPPRHESFSSPNPAPSHHSSTHLPATLQRAPDQPSAAPSSVVRQAGFLFS